MLILTRCIGESIVIGDEITVTILGVRGNQIRVGIKAPKDVVVHREEVFKRLQPGGETLSAKPSSKPASKEGTISSPEKADSPS